MQVCSHRQEFADTNTRIIIVSFSNNHEWARRWLDETCQAFTLLLDTDRQLYRSLGLERSLRRSWNLRTLLHYVRYLLTGWKWRGIQGDSAQLGGNFMIDDGGILRFAHRSFDPTDRPSIRQLIKIARRLNQPSNSIH